MGSIAVVTTFSPTGYEVYGKRMLETFDQYWPKDIDLFVYYEGVRATDPPGRGEWLPLDADMDRRRFMARHRDHPFNYRYMPVKFSHKVWAITDAAQESDEYDWLIWLDGDIETRAPVTHEFLQSILPDGVIASYLGRRWWKHTEIPFQTRVLFITA